MRVSPHSIRGSFLTLQGGPLLRADARLATLERFQPKDSPLFLLDPRLVFLAGSDAVPLYLSKFAAYERALHPNVAALQLAAFVDAIAPFLDARVGAWLEGLTKHVHVGRQAEDWLQARR